MTDELAAALAVRPGEVRAQSRWSRVSGTRPHGSPSPEADVLSALTGEVLRLRDEASVRLGGAPRVPGASSGMARSRGVAWLVEQLDQVLALEGLVVESDAAAGGELGVVDWALAWESRLRRMVDDEPGWTPARCAGCGERNLRWQPRAGYFVCQGCGRHVSEAEAMDRVTEEAGA